jgi:hypothetical protein
MLKDISNFENKDDYLPILNGILITGVIMFILLYLDVIKSKYLRLWYDKLSLSAVISDLSIIMIYIIIIRYLYTKLFNSFDIRKLLFLGIIVQITLDLLLNEFYKKFDYGTNAMIDILKYFIDELGGKILIGDALIVSSSLLIGSFLAEKDMNTNIIVLIVVIYILPYLYTNTQK